MTFPSVDLRCTPLFTEEGEHVMLDDEPLAVGGSSLSQRPGDGDQI